MWKVINNSLALGVGMGLTGLVLLIPHEKTMILMAGVLTGLSMGYVPVEQRLYGHIGFFVAAVGNLIWKTYLI